MNKPKIRFKGFEGEWKKVKIGDVAPLTGGFAFQSGQFKTSGVPIIRISNILSSGIVGGDFVYYNEFKGDSEFRLYKGDVVIAMSGATTGKVATFEANDFGYQNQRVGKFSRTNLVNYELLSKLVSAPNFQKKIISKLTSSAQPNASSKDIDSIDLVVPEETEEQRALASYFTSLDAQIAASTSRLSSLKQIKAASQLNMFPQKGETVPRVRFKGFQGEWKKVKIGDVAPLTGGFAFQSGQFKTSGVPIIRISNILSSGIVGGDFVYYNEFKGDSEFRLYKGDVVIAMSGATTGKVATFEANDFGYQNQRVGKFSRTNLVNYELLSKLVSAPNFQKKIISKLTSSAQPNASSKDIDSIDLVVPEETEEQQAIASYFTALDAQITLHRERLEKLKQIKAACLEKMFA